MNTGIQDMEKKQFSRWNYVVAAVVFVVATFTYLSTIEPTASFWDCGEFIASSYKLEVGHPPGNPVFQLIARFFTMFTGPGQAAVMVNAMSGLCSALTIFFLYLTIVFFVRRILVPSGSEEYSSDKPSRSSAAALWAPWPLFLRHLLVLCGGRGGVRMSSLFTAMVFWAMIKWYDRRPALRQSLDRADFLPDGAFHRDSSAEPARHSRSRVPVLLQDAGRQALLLLGICQDPGDFGRDPGFSCSCWFRSCPRSPPISTCSS